MKTGDKLLCKKSRKLGNFIKGKTYQITEIQNIDQYRFDERPKFHYIYWFGEGPYHAFDDFHINNIDWYIWKYFYTLQETRKMKLKNLKNEI